MCVHVLLVHDGIRIAWLARILKAQIIGNFIYRLQGKVQLLLGVGGRKAKANATFHNGRGRESSTHCGNVPSSQGANYSAEIKRKNILNIIRKWVYIASNLPNFRKEVDQHGHHWGVLMAICDHS